VRRNANAFTVVFNVLMNTSGETYEGAYNEIDGDFLMDNGPKDWLTIQYQYDGDSCPEG
jgi:hypothetical protein